MVATSGFVNDQGGGIVSVRAEHVGDTKLKGAAHPV